MFKNKVESISNTIAVVLLLAFTWIFYASISKFIFHPSWATDDALQQVFPFHKVYHPNLFKDDLITNVMEGYLAPVHYWLAYVITWMTGDPIMMAHWVTLIQWLLLLVFIYLATKHLAGTTPAIMSVLWIIHTRPLMQRMTGGLPRAWAAVVIAAFAYYVLKEDHKKIHLVLLFGCLLHPPATIIAASAYGCYLLYRLSFKVTRSLYIKPFLLLILLTPLYLFVTYQVVKREPEIGSMISIEEAAKLPEFSRPYGRFPFVPLNDLKFDLRHYAYQPFFSRLHDPGSGVKDVLIYLIPIIFVIVSLYLWKKRKPLPASLQFLLFSIIFIYMSSRFLAFRLYVPDRHIQMPMAIFWVIVTAAICGKLFSDKQNRVLLNGVFYLLLGGLVYFTSGSGLQGTLNYNYTIDKRGEIFRFVRDNTPENAIFAGDPTHIDGMMLYGRRQAYATTETAHPFYQGYFKEILRRAERSFRAHYATNTTEFFSAINGEKIDYFVFAKRNFYPAILKECDYFEPLRNLAIELCSKDPESYLYKHLSKRDDLKQAGVVLFEDKESLLIDVKKLESWVNEKGI